MLRQLDAPYSTDDGQILIFRNKVMAGVSRGGTKG